MKETRANQRGLAQIGTRETRGSKGAEETKTKGSKTNLYGQKRERGSLVYTRLVWNT